MNCFEWANFNEEVELLGLWERHAKPRGEPTGRPGGEGAQRESRYTADWTSWFCSRY